MKNLNIKISTIVLLLIYKVTSTSYFENKSNECHLYYQWTGEDPNDYPPCCEAVTPYICNDDDRVDGLILNSRYHNHPDFSTFPIFEQLTNILIRDYGGIEFVEPFDLHINIFKQPRLKQLFVNSVYVDDIATDIDPNCPLEELTLNNTQIERLPNSIFKLNNLKKIELGDNSKMNVKIVKFKNSPIECKFINTNIDCYQEGACNNISSNDYKKCTEDEINEILGKEEIENPVNQTKSDSKDISNSGNKSKNNEILIRSIIGIGVILFYLF